MMSLDFLAAVIALRMSGRLESSVAFLEMPVQVSAENSSSTSAGDVMMISAVLLILLHEVLLVPKPFVGRTSLSSFPRLT